jgi:hypothetical protein
MIGGAALSAYSSNKASKEQASATRDAAAMADPFRSQRGFYQNILRDVYSGYGGAEQQQQVAPGGMFGSGIAGSLGNLVQAQGTGNESVGAGIGNFIRSNPAYQFNMEETMRGTARQAGAQGMFKSGNLLASLQNRASGLASQTYDAEIGRIMGMAGATSGSPGAAGQIAAQGAQAQYGNTMQTAGNIGYGLSGLSRYGTDQGWWGGGSTPAAPSAPVWV